MYVTVKSPDDSFETHKLRTTSDGYFEVPLRFDKTSKAGVYKVEASYLDHKDSSMDFVFFANFEQIVSAPKIEKYTPVPVSKVAFGKYLEDISYYYD